MEFSPALLLTMWAPLTDDQAEEDEEQADDTELHCTEKRDEKSFSKQLDDSETLQKCIMMAKKCDEPQK